MLLRDFVQHIIKTIREAQVSEKKPTDVFLEFESQLTLQQITDLTTAEFNLDKEVNDQTLAPYIKLLQDRWPRIQNTDAAYPHSPYSAANKVALELAIQIQFHTKGRQIAAKMLMPTLLQTQLEFNEGKLEYISDGIHRAILTDDNLYPVDVLKCLVDFKKGQNLRRPNPVGVGFVPLTKEEKHRVKYHSTAANQLYQFIKDDNGTRTEKEFKNAKSNLKAKLAKGQDYLCKVTYGEPGRLKLRDNLHGVIHTRDKLLHMMQQYALNKHEAFLDSFSLSDLRQMVLNGKTFKEALQDQSLYVGDEALARSVLLLFALLYKRELVARESEYITITGWLFGYSKDQKKPAVNVLIEYLTSGQPLSQFAECLDTVGVSMHKGALTSDTLGSIVEQLTIAANPTYRDYREPLIEKKTSGWW